MSFSGAPYQTQMRLLAGAPDPTCHKLPAPTRGTIVRFIIKQTTGTLSGFTATLYNAELPCGVSAESFADVGADDALSEDMFQIAPEFVVNAGGNLSQNFGLDYDYASNELAGNGRLATALWLQIRADGTGDKTFEVAYTITPSKQSF